MARCAAAVWTEDTLPTAGFAASPPVPLSLEAAQLDGSRSTNGTAEKWTFASVDNKCEATSTDDAIVSYTWDFADGRPSETDPALAGFPAGPCTPRAAASGRSSASTP